MADAFEAMTGTRPYQDQLTSPEALAQLSENVGTQFDAACVEALAQVVDGTESLEPAAEPDLRDRRGLIRSTQPRRGTV